MRNKEDLLDKKLYHLGNELQALHRRLYVTVPLLEPIRFGWRRYHVLSSKADCRRDKDVLKAILSVVGTTRYSRTRDFREKRGRKHRRKLVEVEQPPRELAPFEWDRKCLPEAWLKYFRLESRLYSRTWCEVLVFAHPGLFELKVAPNLVWELQHPDPEVARRMAQIHSWLESRHLMRRLERVCGWRHWKQMPNPKERYDHLVQRELRAAKLNPWEADVTNDIRVRHISFLHISTFIFSPA